MTALALGAVLLSATAIAASGTKGVAAALAADDTDKDGTLSLDEVNTAAGTKFDAADTDKDGTLSAAEAKAAGISKKALKAGDADKDGTLDKTEFMTIVKTKFTAADTDGDGKLTKAELSSKAGHALLHVIQ
jgi:Ca2+-binding EF-hand superfamily protein